MTEASLTKSLAPALSIRANFGASAGSPSVGVSSRDKAELPVDVETEIEGNSVFEARLLRPL